MSTPTDTSKESSRRDVSKTALFGICTLYVVEQSSLESKSRGCAKTPILRVFGLTRGVLKEEAFSPEITTNVEG